MSILTSTNPANNYSLVGNVAISTQEEILAKVQKAQQAKRAWKIWEYKNAKNY